ncbi:acyl carrier protein mbtL [Mycobacterium tuberculosis]|nr:acyl carrier protein mbtL [Mycobacterium tuberculosis]
MTSSPSTVSTTLLSILRDDLNIDLTRVTPDARLVDDVGLDSVAFAVVWWPSRSGSESHCPKRSS